MSNRADVENDESLHNLTPDDDAAPADFDRRSAQLESIEPKSFDDVPDHDDGPEVLAELESENLEVRRSGVPSVRWANDADQPDFAHLVGAENNGLELDSVVKLTPEILDLLVEANSFRPELADGKYVFALRGGKLKQHRYIENVASVDIEITRPDHRNFRCTLGYYDVANRKLSAYLGSTVPNTQYMTNYYKKKNRIRPYRNINANILPTGCYVYRKNAHGGGKINPAMRMTEPASVNSDAVATVLRTSNDLTFKHNDFWDRTTPYDNIHCAYFTSKFSSAGCQTISGANRKGAWGRFQKELDRHKWDTRFGYVLLTGREVAIAAKILSMPPANRADLINKYLRRLRVGSFGPEVSALQIKMGYSGKTQYFGPSTRKKLVEYEEQHKVKTDSIYSWQDDQVFGWNVFKPAAPPTERQPQAEQPPKEPIIPPQQPAVKSVQTDLKLRSLVLTAGPHGAEILENGKKIAIPAEGIWLVRDETGTLEFQPQSGAIGAVPPIAYEMERSTGGKQSARVSVALLEAHKAPIVAGETVRVVEGQATSIVVHVHDVEGEGEFDPESTVLVQGPQGSKLTASQKTMTVPNVGAWIVDPITGQIEFDPYTGFIGVTKTEYEITNRTGDKSRAQAEATVAPLIKRSLDDSGASDTQGFKPIIVTINPDTGTRPRSSSTSALDQFHSPHPTQNEASAVTPGPTVMPGPTASSEANELQWEGAVKFTEEEIRRFVPRAKEKYVRALVDHGPKLLAQHGISATPMRLCHFLGQISHESGGFTIDRESMYYTTASRIRQVWPSRFKTVNAAKPYVKNEKKLAEKVYGGRMRDLGNSQPGDGYKYRGRGLIQITGRANYRDMGRKIEVDLEGAPDKAFEGYTALLIAVQTWTDRTRSGRTMNQLADTNKIEIITKRINGGYTNIGHRKSEFEKAWKIWGTGQPPRAIKSDTIERGERGEKVKQVQRLLIQKGYFPADETVDGIFGGKTMKAVARFQHVHNQTAVPVDRVNVNGIVDKKTLAALRSAPSQPRRGGGIPRNARDPRNLQTMQGSALKRAPDYNLYAAETDTPEKMRRHSVIQLCGVVAIVSALALLTVSLFPDAVDPLRAVQNAPDWKALTPYLYTSFGLAVFGGFLLLCSAAPRRHRPARPAAAGREVVQGPEASSEILAQPAEMEGDAEEPLENDVLGADAPLHDYNLRDIDFVDEEPIREAQALPEDMEIGPTGEQDEDQELPALNPEDGLEEPGAPDARNGFSGEGGASVAPFEVSNRDVRLVLIKMFGGDNNLSHQVENDLNEIADGLRNGAGDTAVIALADLADAPGSIIEVSPRGERRTIANLDEIDTGDPETLANFVARALVTYPHARKAVGFWDHGTGTFDEFDPDEVLLERSWKAHRDSNRLHSARRLLVPAHMRPQLRDNPNTRGMLHDNTGGILTNIEAGRMLRAAFHRSGHDELLDLIYSDTCLNGMVEVLDELGDYARCIVASSDTEPGAGWDYERWISFQNEAFPATPEAWSRTAVQAFSDRYQHDVSQHPCTLAAFTTNNMISEAFADLIDSADAAASPLKGWFVLNHARSMSQGYDSRDSYDLIDFAQKLQIIAEQHNEPKMKIAGERLDFACREARLDFVAHGKTVIASQGLAFWFPSSKQSLVKDLGTYRNLKFAVTTGWADYLERNYLTEQHAQT